MARVAGIDPGTKSMDILVLDDESMEVVYERVIDRREVTRNPSIVLRALEEAGRLDAVVAPSGYGIPLKPAREASDEEICLATFVHPGDYRVRMRIHGLRELMVMIRSSGIPAWFTPGVVHLPTVPRWRKLGRIDLGTADKVYTTAAALRDEVELHGSAPGEASFIVAEVGYAYTAAMAVSGGAIVDGVGGTSGPPGYLGLGAWDAELAYAVAAVEPGFSKERLFQGGAAYLYSSEPPEPGDLARAYEAGDPRAEEAVRALAEGVAKAVASLLPSNPRPRRVYLSGRMARDPVIGRAIEDAVKGLLDGLGLGVPVERVSRLGRETKEAATGAALIASGLAGGRYEWLVDSLRLRESGGTILDFIELPGLKNRLRDALSSCRLPAR